MWGVIQKLPFSHTKNVTAEEIKRLKKWPETTSNDFHALWKNYNGQNPLETLIA